MSEFLASNDNRGESIVHIDNNGQCRVMPSAAVAERLNLGCAESRALKAIRKERDALAEEVARLKQEREKLLPLARRTLWIAYSWNDHNFEPPHLYAREEAESLGINSMDAGNEFLCKAYGWTEDQPNEQ